MKGIACAMKPNEEDLKQLLNVFGSQFSLEDMASAYYEAKGNVTIAGDILCAKNDERTLRDGADSFENMSVNASTTSVELSSAWVRESSASSEYTFAEHNNGELKPKKSSVSMGSISGVIGKNYFKPSLSSKDSLETTKPVKIDSKELPDCVIWSKEDSSGKTTRNGTTHGDLEEFLFEMLGDGFQLDKSVIQEVLDCCVFDVDQSMDKLLNLSASTLEKSDDVIGIAAEKLTGTSSDNQFILVQDKMQSKDFASSEEAKSMITNPRRSPQRNKDRVALEKEILEALFTVPERFGEPKKTRLTRVVRRSRAFGELVTKPLTDTDTSLKTTVVELLKVSRDVEDGHDDDENSYDVLRQAVKEHWITMKEYYKAAVEAFVQGDKARATQLMDLGHFFNKKAREADERSAEKMLETSCRDDEIISLDLHHFEPKEALNLLRVHLTSVSGIPSFKYLRINVGTIEEDTKKRARKRLMEPPFLHELEAENKASESIYQLLKTKIMKQLEKEGIKWNEEENGQIISIRVDVLNTKCLSFTKKKNQTSMGFS